MNQNNKKEDDEMLSFEKSEMTNSINHEKLEVSPGGCCCCCTCCCCCCATININNGGSNNNDTNNNS